MPTTNPQAFQILINFHWLPGKSNKHDVDAAPWEQNDAAWEKAPVHTARVSRFGANLRANPLMLLASYVSIPIYCSVFHNLRAHCCRVLRVLCEPGRTCANSVSESSPAVWILFDKHQKATPLHSWNWFYFSKRLQTTKWFLCSTCAAEVSVSRLPRVIWTAFLCCRTHTIDWPVAHRAAWHFISILWFLQIFYTIKHCQLFANAERDTGFVKRRELYPKRSRGIQKKLLECGWALSDSSMQTGQSRRICNHSLVWIRD